MTEQPDQTFKRVVELLEACVEDRGILAEIPQELRVRLLMAAGRLSHPERDASRRLRKVLEKNRRQQVRAADREVVATTGIRAARRETVFQAPARELSGRVADAVPEERPELLTPRNCYVCKELFTKLHFFYDALCPTCAPYNYDKRFQTTSLEGRTALITGARIKIGYHAALMMLRAGARVLVTTRFPRDAAARFAREPDFAQWESRLAVYGLDLRHSPSVESFARYVLATEKRLDIVIDNAAQTVRRPAGFYAHLIERETIPFAELEPAVTRRPE